MIIEKGDYVKHKRGKWEGYVVNVKFEELEKRYMVVRLSDGYEFDLHESEFDIVKKL